MIAASFMLPFNNGVTYSSRNFVYYFDTLLTEDDGYLMPTDSIYAYGVMAFVTFDLNGNKLEQHFLQMAYEDTLGHIIRERVGEDPYTRIPYTRIYIGSFPVERLTVDNQGNIIIVRQANDQAIVLCDTCDGGSRIMTVRNGEIGALKILVNGTPRHTWYPTHRSDGRNFQIMKFSPGFEDLLSAIYILDSTDAYTETIDTSHVSIYFNSIETDNEGYIYIDMVHLNYPSVPLSNSDTLRLSATDMSCCVKYSPHLKPIMMYNIESLDYYSDYSLITPEGELYRFCHPNWYELNGQNSHVISYRGDTLDLNNLAFWLRLDATDGSMLAYGKAPATVETWFNGFHKRFVVAGNRVFGQIKYVGTVEAPGITIQSEPGCWGMGLMQWDTEGHVIGFTDFASRAGYDANGQTHLVDSVVYMTGIVMAGATFGATQVEESDNGTAFIAKYVDTSLMRPYVYSDPRQPQYIEWEQDLTLPLTDTLVTLTATATSGLPVGYSCDDSTVALVIDGVLQPLRVGTATVTATQGGSTYGYYPAAPVTKLVTIHNVGIDDIQNSAFNIQNLSIYPNPTRGDVYIHTEGETVKKVNLYSSDGRQLPIQPQGTTVPLSPYPAGVYYLQLTTQTGTCQFKVTKY